MTGTWGIALRNLARNKRRNLATGFAISLGFAALLALGGYVNRVENYLRVQAIYLQRTGHIAIYKKDGLARYSIKPRDYSLTEADQRVIREAIAKLDNVQLHGGQLTGSGLIGNGCRTVPFMAIGIEPRLERALREHPEVKRWSPRSKLSKGRGLYEYDESVGPVILAQGLARLLHKTRVYDEFPKDQKTVLVTDCQAPGAKELLAADANVQLAAGAWTGMMSALDGEVVAQFDTGLTETMNSGMVSSLHQMQALYDTANVSSYSLWLRNASRLQATLNDLAARLRVAGLEVDLYTWNQEAVSPMYTGTMQFLMTMVIFIAVVLSLVIVLSIFNAATMTIIERGQEVGMMRSLGFTQGQIRRLFIEEMALLAAISLAAGGVIGTLVILGVNRAGIEFNPPGIAGGQVVELIPTSGMVVAAASLIVSLALLTTVMAIRSIVKMKIPHLLMGSHR